MEITKYCSKCDTTKPINQFCKNKRSVDGHAFQCKSCVKEYQLTIRDKWKEYQKVYQAKYRPEHKERLYQQQKDWVKINPEKARAHVAASKARNAEYYKAYAREWSRQNRLRKKLEKQQQQPND